MKKVYLLNLQKNKVFELFDLINILEQKGIRVSLRKLKELDYKIIKRI